MNMKEAVISVLKNWNDFTGRASRSEFWYFCLAYFLIAIAVSFVDIASGTADLESGQMEMIDMTFGQMGIASVILNLFLLVPSLSVTSRRLQDRGYSGWWQLSYITILGVFVIVLLCMLPSKEDENKWGRNPKLKN